MFRSSSKLSDVQSRIYPAETYDNFRWAAKLLARPPSYTLTSADLSSVSLQLELAELGQFAEVAHGNISLAFLWENMDTLLEPTYPLEGYDALCGSVLHSAFRGSVAQLQAYIAYRPKTKQLVIAFSGTSNVAQALRNLDVRLVGYSSEGVEAVHAGFWVMYNGLRSDILGALTEALQKYTVVEVVFTGHSLGGVMCYLLALDVVRESSKREQIHDGVTMSQLKLAVFGCPRVGNLALARYWREAVRRYCSRNGQDSVSEYSVKGRNDGIPAIPPKLFGYHHFCRNPLYSAHANLYHIPESMSEYSTFRIQQAEGDPSALIHPLGGHLYYNTRDMERTLRSMQWIDLLRSRGQNWKECYKQHPFKATPS